MRHLPAVLILLAAQTAWGQFDDRLWLVQSVVVAPTGLVLEVSRTGSVIGSYPGPNGGSSGVIKDLLNQRVFVADDAGGRLFIYRAGYGQVGVYNAPGIKGIAEMSNGDLAVLIDNGFLVPGQVQVIPQSWASQPQIPWPPPVIVGFGPTRILAGPNETLWVMNMLGSTLSRVQAGAQQILSLASVSPNTFHGMCMRRDGGLVVTFNNVNVAALVDPTGAVAGTLALPEPPLRMAADGDGALLMIGSSGTFYALNAVTGVTDYSFALGPAASFRGLIPDHENTFWLENGSAPSLTHYGWQGNVLAVVPLPVATSTMGDPLGLEFAAKTNPAADVDNDGVPSGAEFYLGSDFLSAGDLPALLTSFGAPGAPVVLNIYAPTYPLEPCLILAGVSGNQPFPLGPDGHSAPYLDLTFDALTAFLLLGDPFVLQAFQGLPIAQLDSVGTATAVVDLSVLNVPPGTVTLFAGVVVVPGLSYWAVTSNGVRFTN